MFIFDTDIYTNVMRKIPSEKLINRLKMVSRRDQFTTTITIAEVYYGLMKASNRTNCLNFLNLSFFRVRPFCHLPSRLQKNMGKSEAFWKSREHLWHMLIYKLPQSPYP